MQKNTIGSLAIQAEMVATADKCVFSFSFILANMVFHVCYRLCRACGVKCKGERRKKTMQQSREVEF